jgi:uncharacterized protein (TIGR02246 family)
MPGRLGMLTALLLILPHTAGQPAPTPTETTLIANERALYDAVAKGDRTAFLSLTLPEGLWTTLPGFVPMKMLGDRLDTFALNKWDIVNPHVIRLDDNSAVVVYSWQGAGTSQNLPLPPTLLASTTWTKRDGKWLAAFHQETELTK